MAQDSLIGKTLANFRIDSRLGQGGMAVVYLGMDIKLDRPVAIKLINAQFQGNPAYAERFVAEAKLVARWRHENIISVFYADQQDDLYYFVMEYIDGATLEDLMKRYLLEAELMSHTDVIRIGRAVAGGLDYAHKQGVVHRDVKPANIMINRDDRVVVTDFGLALDMGQGSMGQIFGTPHYVAPEQVRHSADASPQSDIYSLGIVLYEMLTGILPFDDPSATALAVQHLTEPPPPPRSMNPALNQQTEDALLKALAKEPENRYETAIAFIDALDIALQAPSDETETVPDIMLPAAITRRVHEVPKVSMMSISEILELELEGKEAPIPAHTTNPAMQNPTPEKSKKPAGDDTVKVSARPQTVEVPEKDKSNMPLFAGIGVIGLILIIVIVGFVLNSSGENNADDIAETVPDTAVVQASDEAVVQATAIDSPTIAPTDDTVVIIPTDSPTIVPTTLATDSPVIAATDDIEATIAVVNATNHMIETENAYVQATNVANELLSTSQAIALATSNAEVEVFLTQTQQANQANTVPLSPTELYPSGRLLELTYNSAGFYLRNSSDSRVRDSRLAFQAIDANGNSIGTPFNGVNWAIGYNFVDSTLCASIELLDQSSWAPPNSCGNYNARINRAPTHSEVFWTGSNGAVQFIVYWDNSEIARCTIANGYCQVRVGE